MTTEIKKADAPFDDEEADVIIRSSDHVDFYVFKAFLAYSSSAFKDMFCIAQGSPEKGELKDGLQVIPTNDDSETWRILLRFSYPLHAAGPPTLESLDEFSRALESSRKYGMARAEKMIIEDLISPRFVETVPMRVFALACQYRLDAEARTAAKQTLHTPILGRPYFPEMENMSAVKFHRLQEYHQQCGKVASELAKNPVWIKKSDFVWFGNTKHTGDCGIKDQRTANTSIGNVMVTAWWEDYMHSAAKALEDRPSGVVVSGAELMDKALRKASLCTKCSPKAFAEMREFGDVFAAEVDRAIAKVVLNIEL